MTPCNVQEVLYPAPTPRRHYQPPLYVLVRSVQDYGCEIWAPGMLSKVKGLKMDGEHERILKMFMRRALGVRDSATNEVLMAVVYRPGLSGWPGVSSSGTLA